MTDPLSVAQFRAQLDSRFKANGILNRQLLKEWISTCYAEARQASAWQPIASAPKDLYTPILTFRRAGLMAVAVYAPSGESEWCCSDGMQLLDVTHFQFLPLAPPVLEDDAHER